MNFVKFLLLSAACLLTVQATSVFARTVTEVELDDSEDLANWCAKPVALTRISQLGLLVGKLDQLEGCADRTKEALIKLKQLIDETKSQQCSIESVGKYQDYYNQYLDTSNKNQKALNSGLPAPLRTFALAYGLELSGLCRVNMVKVLINDVRKALPDKDLDLIDPLIDPMGPIAETLRSGGKRPDDLILPSDFISATSFSAEKKKLAIKIETTPIMKKLQLICERRFEPVYGPLMLPVAKLANMGFEFRSKDLKKILKENAKNYTTCQDIANWSRIVFMCEGLRQVQLVEMAVDKQRAEGDDATLVQVFDNKQEAQEALEALEGGGEELLAKAQVKNENNIEQLQFEPNLTVQMPDVVVKSFLSKQKLSLAWLNTNRDESQRTKMRFFSRTYRMITADLKSLRFDKFFLFFLNEIRKQAKIVRTGGVIEEKNITEELVKIFNEQVNNELNPEMAVADDCDCGGCDCGGCDCGGCGECCSCDCFDGCAMPSICIWTSTTNNYGSGRYGRHGYSGGYGGYRPARRRGGGMAVFRAVCIIIIIVMLIALLVATIHAVLMAG